MPGRGVVAAMVALVLASGGLLTATAADATTGPSRPSPIINPRTGLPVGLMPTVSQARRSAARAVLPFAGAKLTYQGGPLVTDARVESVLWGSGTYVAGVGGTPPSTMDTWFKHVTDSSYLAWLGEYQHAATVNPPVLPAQTIDYGAFLGRTTITPSTSATSISDTTVQSELAAQIGAGHLPAPVDDGTGNSSTVYAVFFPAGTTICYTAGQCSGVVFCAYHNTTSATIDGVHVPYMVLPDAHSMGAGCGTGTDLQNTESYTSHELVETITDPLVGLNILSWYDNTNGEIGDICNGQESTLDTSYTVQALWSNAQNACIANKAGSAPTAPIGATAASAPGGTVDLSWSAPASDGGSAINQYVVYESTVPGVHGSTVATLPGTATSWSSPALPDGTRYFEVAARNGTAVQGPDTGELSAIVDGSPPTLTVPSPARFRLSTSIPISYSATDSGSGVASYDVEKRSAAWNGSFGGYTTVASATSATSQSLTGSPGHEYCFRVRARDHAGNVSAWSTDRCTSIPLDDRALATATSGWTRSTASAAYRGTLTTTTKLGAKLTLTNAMADRVALVVQTCAACGKVGIYLGGTLWHTVNTAAASTHNKVVVLPGTFTEGTTTLTLKNLSSGKKVAIDGLGVSQN